MARDHQGQLDPDCIVGDLDLDGLVAVVVARVEGAAAEEGGCLDRAGVATAAR
jgi:hypothetical protein